MNKNKKLISVLALSLSVLSGCNNSTDINKDASSKTSSKKEESQYKAENTQNHTEESQSKAENTQNHTERSQSKVETIQHNKEEAKKLVNDITSFQVNNFDIQKTKIERSIPPGFATLPTLSKEVRKVYIDNVDHINVIKLAEVIDVYNTYNKNTYNEEDVLKDVKKILKSNSLIIYSESEEKSQDKSDDELKKILEKMGSVIYFKGDKTFACNLPFGLGGAGFPQAAPESDWIEDGDSLEIPMISPVDKKIASRIVVKINNKNYFGGSKKSYYYYYDVK